MGDCGVPNLFRSQ